ncbi:MAG: hypothetical protein LUC92_06075 [Clostridiales bacterium]|nr:hypothetical protein [Clostridiales bacterium]
MWVNISTVYNSWVFEVISEGDDRNKVSNPGSWTLYQAPSGESEITEGYTQVVSTLGALLNDTSGNAATATALSGTLAIANGGTGGTTAAEARTNLELDDCYKRLGYATAGGASNISEDRWYKFAETTISTAYEHRTITFDVHNTSGNMSSRIGSFGKLTAKIRLDESGITTNLLAWEYAGSGLDLSNFVLAYNKGTVPAIVELWAKPIETNHRWVFTVVSENGTGYTPGNSNWTLYQPAVSDYESEITEGYTQVISTLETLRNDTTGNAATADKLTTARTIQTNLAGTSASSFDGSANITPGVTGVLPLANGGTGGTTAEEARTNLGLDSTYRKYKYAYAGISANTGTDNWFKFAEISAPTTNNVDLRISFKVSAGTGIGLSGYAGILTAHVRTTSAGVFYAEQSELSWEYAGSKVKPENFVMAYSEETPTVVELWVNIPTQYDYWHFDVIAEGRRSSNSNFTDWTLYQTTKYSSEITEGYTQIASTIGTLQNDTAGNAAGLTGTLALTNGGTGGTTAEEARTNLGLGAAAVREVDSEVTEGSKNLVTSGAVYEAIQAAVNELYEKLTG